MEQTSFIKSIIDKQAEKHIYWTFGYVLKWVLIISVLIFSTGIGALLFGSSIAYADDSGFIALNFTNDLSGSYNSSNDFNEITNGMTEIYNRNNFIYKASTCTAYPIYFCMYGTGPYKSLFLTKNADQNFNYAWNTNGGQVNGSWSVSKYGITLTDENYPDVYYNRELFTFNNIESLNTANIPHYLSLEGALSAFSTYVPAGDLNVSTFIEPGYVAYIQSTGDLTLTTTFEQDSKANGTWANITQLQGTSSTLISSDTNFPLPGMTQIQWQGYGKKSFPFGTYKKAQATVSSATGNNYTVIYNPLFQQYGQGNNYDANGRIYFQGNITSIKICPLSGSVALGQGLVSDWGTSYGSGTAVIDQETGEVTYVDENGDPYEQSRGGMDNPPEDTSMEAILENFVSSFNKVFEGPIAAIQTLINSASGFFQVVSGLWTWLPSDVVAVIKSCLIVCASLAVIKLLFR